jgi:hypothetical protein
MVSASKLVAKYQVALPRVAGWASRKLSAATVLGLALLALLPEQMPPFLAAASPPAPVEMVRTLPVPYLDGARPEPASALSAGFPREAPARILQVVAQRSHARSQARREPESGALGKAGTGTDKGPDKAAAAAPAPPANAKGDSGKGDASKTDPNGAAPKAEPPEPDAWSDTEVIAALRDCLRRLAPLGAEIEVGEPIRQERCGAPAPVLLKRIGSGAARVEFQPPAMLNCAMVASLHTWVEKTLQPAAQEVLGSPVVRVRNVSGYVCRNRVGTTFHADRLSEHALANAIDIAAFVTADGRTVDVLGRWGPTARDLREQQETAWEAVQEAKAATKEADAKAAEAARAARSARGNKQAAAKAEAERTKQEAERRKEHAQEKEAEWRRALARAAEFQKLARPEGEHVPRLRRSEQTNGKDARGLRPGARTADAKGTIPIPESEDGESLGPTPDAVFLRRLHRGACSTFGTVLGPDANEAHRNHFHLDLATRKRSAFCE